MAIEDGEPNNLYRRQGQRLAGVLASHCAKADLARHLGRVALVRLPGGQQSLFRYFDPVVLDLLWPQLDEAQRVHLMGPVARWHLLDRQAHWMNLALASTTTGLERGVAALALTPTQLADLKRVTLVNQAAAMASAELGERLAFRKIESALGASAWAETQGLTDAGDQVAMLSLFLMSGMQMLHHPIMTPVWQAVRGGCSWSVATDILTHEDWITVSTS